jgi:ferredoxin
MRVVTVRRISQAFFFALFVWFCIVTTFGTAWWQLRGWPTNWFIQLDPLAAIGTVLTTRALYRPLLWALLTVGLTILLGRFFCSWVCPFGSIHHFISHLVHHKTALKRRIEQNKYRKPQCVKYVILIVLLLAAIIPANSASLQTGLLDPIPLVSRSFNLVLLPIVDRVGNNISTTDRFYEGAGVVFAVFLAAVALNLVVPRFYCRFVCPLGALFGILGRYALWRIGKNKTECSECKVCEKACQGGCQPAGRIRISECVLCFNCHQDCKEGIISYQTRRSLGGELIGPDLSRRGFVVSLAGGVVALPAIRLSNKLGANWHYRLIRPPGALAEEEFLKRCIKCGQCMRICPTNVIQPGGLEGGLENLWTPVLNNRIGTSGCQLNCTACGYICPTSAIRPISLSEKLGINEFAEAGPIRLGTAFVDRSRCLPWAMDKPCIVCQENCPVSPKAIYTQEYFSIIRNGLLPVEKVRGTSVQLKGGNMEPGMLASGDYYCRVAGVDTQPVQITANSRQEIVLSTEPAWLRVVSTGEAMEIQVRLQRPLVDIEKCIGCGVCEHECPVSGKRAIRVSAEGETRSAKHRLLLRR